MMRVLITGAEGFIGKALARKLRDFNYEIFTLDVNESTQKFEHIQIDIIDPKIHFIFQEIRPDVVIHLAAQINVLKSFEQPFHDLQSNGQGTLNLIQASIESGCTNFVYIASGGATYNSNQLLPIGEKGQENPVSPYGLTKLLGEGYVRIFSEKAGTCWSSLALSNCYGPVLEHGRGVIFQFWKALYDGKSPIINGIEVTRDMIHIDDVVRAIQLAIESPTNSRVNISSGSEVTLLQIFELIRNEMRSNVEPEIRDHIKGEVERSSLSNKKAFEILGWEPTISLESGIKSSLPSKELPK